MDIEVRMYIVCSVLEVEKLEGWLVYVQLYISTHSHLRNQFNSFDQHEKRVSATRDFNVDNSKPFNDKEKKI